MTSASHLATGLRKLGDFKAARQLDEDALAWRHRILGGNHPDTLESARNLNANLRALDTV